jgi:hypothetical protein
MHGILIPTDTCSHSLMIFSADMRQKEEKKVGKLFAVTLSPVKFSLFHSQKTSRTDTHDESEEEFVTLDAPDMHTQDIVSLLEVHQTQVILHSQQHPVQPTLLQSEERG